MVWRDTPRALTLITAPTAEPVTYATVKAWLRLPDDTDETVVKELLAAARERVEADTGIACLTQTWDLYLDAFPSDAIRVPIRPLQSVTTIKTTTAAAVQSTLAATNYQVDIASAPPRIVLSDTGNWPSNIRNTQGIVIRLIVGHTTTALIPRRLIKAIWGLVAIDYQVRTGLQAILPPRWLGYDAEIAPYRLWESV